MGILGVWWGGENMEWAEHPGTESRKSMSSSLCPEFCTGSPSLLPRALQSSRECETPSLRKTVLYSFFSLNKATTQGTRQWRIWPMGKFIWKNVFFWVSQSPWDCLRVLLWCSDYWICGECLVWILILLLPRMSVPSMWGAVMSCRSEPPLHFRQHSIPPLQAIVPTINTSSSGAQLSLVKTAVTCQSCTFWTSAAPCWVMVPPNTFPENTSTVSPYKLRFQHKCQVWHRVLPQPAFGGQLSRSPFFGSGCHLLEPALSCHIPSPSQNSCQTDIVLPHCPAQLMCPLLSPQGLELLIPNH